MNPFPIRSSHTPALPPHNEISLSMLHVARISVHSLVYRDSTSAQLALKIETKYWHLNYIHLSTIRHLTFSHHFTLNFINQLCSWLSNKRKRRCVWIQKCQCSSAKFNRFERHFPVIIIVITFEWVDDESWNFHSFVQIGNQSAAALKSIFFNVCKLNGAWKINMWWEKETREIWALMKYL